MATPPPPEAFEQPVQPRPARSAPAAARGTGPSGAFRLPPYVPKDGDELVPFTRRRRIIADHMVFSKQTAPDVVTLAECDLHRTALLRDEHKAHYKEEGGRSHLSCICNCRDGARSSRVSRSQRLSPSSTVAARFWSTATSSFDAYHRVPRQPAAGRPEPSGSRKPFMLNERELHRGGRLVPLELTTNLRPHAKPLRVAPRAQAELPIDVSSPCRAARVALPRLRAGLPIGGQHCTSRAEGPQNPGYVALGRPLYSPTGKSGSNGLIRSRGHARAPMS